MASSRRWLGARPCYGCEPSGEQTIVAETQTHRERYELWNVLASVTWFAQEAPTVHSSRAGRSPRSTCPGLQSRSCRGCHHLRRRWPSHPICVLREATFPSSTARTRQRGPAGAGGCSCADHNETLRLASPEAALLNSQTLMRLLLGDSVRSPVNPGSLRCRSQKRAHTANLTPSRQGTLIAG